MRWNLVIGDHVRRLGRLSILRGDVATRGILAAGVFGGCVFSGSVFSLDIFLLLLQAGLASGICK